MSTDEDKKSIGKWLEEMGDWSREALMKASTDLDGTSNKRVAAKKRLRAEGDGKTTSGTPTADKPMEELVNRLEGMPQKAPDIVVNIGPTLAVTTEQIFDRIKSYLSHASGSPFDVTEGGLAPAGTAPRLPTDVSEQRDGEARSDGCGDGASDSEGPSP